MSRNIIRDKLSPYPLSSPLSLHIDPCIPSCRSVNICYNADIPTALPVTIMKRCCLLLLLLMMQTVHAQSVAYDEEPSWTDPGAEAGFTATVTLYPPEPELAAGTAVV